MPGENHIIGSGLTEQELSLASWWQRNGITMKKLGYGALTALSLLLWAFVLWSLLDAYVISSRREAGIPAHIAQNQLDINSLQTTAPQPVQTSEVLVLSTTGDRQNFLVTLTNTNTMWWAEFTYHFDANGQLTPTRHGFILPQSQRYITELGWKGASASAQMVVDDVQWHRVDPAQVARDYVAFSASRWQMELKDPAYQNDLTIGNQTIGRSSFTLINHGGYGFWTVDITAILYRADNPTAVTTVTERQVKPGETRPITIDWFENLPGITKVELQANVNLLDPNVYLSSTRF